MNENARFFQWVSSEKRGEIKIFDKIEFDDNINYISFKDGSRINEVFVAQLNQKDLTGKLMAEIDHPNNCWQFREEWVGREEEKWELNGEGISVCVQPYVPGKKVTRLIPPRTTPPTHSAFGRIQRSFEAENNVVQQLAASTQQNLGTTIDKSDPIYILMSKCKKSDTQISMDMTVSLPPKNLYNIAKESFEEGNDKFIDYIVNEITVNEIKDALKVAIKNMYEEPIGPTDQFPA
jgi:hypothetical protein